MRNIVVRTAALILALLMLPLYGCKSPSPSEAGTQTGAGQASGGAEYINCLSGYTVIRGETSDSAVTEAAIKVRKAVSESAGEEITIATDFIKDKSQIPASAKEILVGETNRAESAAAAEGLGEYDYTVKLDGERIVITGGSPAAAAKAADYFIESVLPSIAGKTNLTEEIDYMYKYEKTDNAKLMPAYVPDDKVTLLSAEPGGDPMTPDWAASLIMMEVHLETATPEGTFDAALKVLDHCAEMGVNGIWLTPIYEKGEGGNGYGNVGPDKVEPALTGTTDQAEGWTKVKWFVDEAHKRNIRIMLDIITWGTVTSSPLFAQRPEWYKGEAWGNQAFDWANEEFCEWYISVAVDNIIKTGADGYRCDCEPNYTGYKIFDKVRERCAEQGRKILVIAEDGCMRKDTYDFEQDGVLNYIGWSRGEQYQTPKRFYIDLFNIVDSVKSGKIIGENSLQNRKKSGAYRFYTYCVSNHDYQYSITNGCCLVLGYQAIFAPFIPLWYFGGEFNMRAEKQVIYFVPVDWSLLDDCGNAMFYEDIKKYIGIRRAYADIFEYWPEDHRDSNICAVQADGLSLAAYARYAGNRAALIIPNNEGKTVSATVHVPFEAAGIAGYSNYTVTDLMTGKVIAEGTAEKTASFNVKIENEHIGVYLVEGK